MTIHCFRYAFASCAFALIPLTAHAQVVEPLPTVPPITQPDELPGQQTPSTRPQAADGLQQPTDSTYEARRVTSPTAERLSVEDFFVKKLTMKNQAEIELSQIATEKAQREEVKQFAQKMIQDHQQMNQQLEQLTSAAGTADRQGTTERQNATQAGTQAAAQQRATEQRAGQGEAVPAQLMQVFEQAGQLHLQMTKQALQNHQGQDFDMAYLSTQVVAHTRMLAALQAMQNVGSSEFQQLVQQAEQKTKGHLEMAKQLAGEFEDDRNTINREGPQTNQGDRNRDL